MMLRYVLILLLMTGCGRALTDTETDFLSKHHGDSLNYSRMRMIDGALVGEVTFERKPRPRVTCRERILPPVKKEVVTVSPAAVTLFNRIFFAKDWYVENYVPEYPGQLHLVGAMLLAHEATHVWQRQNRKITGYQPLKAAAEHNASDDPYLFDLDDKPEFLSFGYEQQGAIMEEYVCCRALAPQAARTTRLHDMLAAVMPVSPLPQSRESDVWLPWKDADLGGICA